MTGTGVGSELAKTCPLFAERCQWLWLQCLSRECPEMTKNDKTINKILISSKSVKFVAKIRKSPFTVKSMIFK